ncbi:hypothetical protein CA850_29790 [Micromonospora echinospora]|uniref:Head-to-tail stopper n=1 Tax=Micromonospora echinospora TaxID=1877 RepID=A0A1C5AAR2_MICEC|nr:hypothetical protein [Micromonospora echinospora]OZV74772.1 hypothetical protein CA850_29790 [Micromonospora echinospora]SCF42322.1 hypothetical protein GA0070618_6643 [Micromonospora echinospora]
MRYPDTVTVLRQTTADEYGNPGSGPHAPAGTWPGFLTGETVFAPPDADVQRGDRLVIGADTYDVEGDPARLRSPSRTVLTRVAVRLRRR